MRNPLLQAITAELKHHPQGCKEYDLIRSLDAQSMFGGLSSDDSVALFQKHFLVMNALYQLQLQFWQEEALYLRISALDIGISPTSVNAADSTLPGDATDASLREYYLDWSNMEGADRGYVEELLDQFWQRFLNQDKRQSALDLLGLSSTATYSEIKQRYRRLANELHPDKGGDTSEFIALREAWEVLKLS
ncbi:DNA-J related domain-containing protein [Marinobacterium jannaschii]|uniref:DNA-J related domain-containing protein n=1 Tax=Marinobacterium jannaschii TaxID=64970 RepID=UPI0004807C81|nr:DNA-J related domain-containing protein [Marinobacterium jannaschii]